ncbi:hypothetical protein BDL97_02G077700 [Sphagnum fallax]|nr:hypothetical protein BDL97_02G077700 [Sphagnum fallax]
MAALLASSCALSSSLTLLASSPSFTSSARLPSSSRSVSGVGVFVAPAAASSSAVKVGIRCQIAAANADDEEASSSSSSVKRRDIFVALGASTIAAGVWSFSPMTPEANAADLIQRQQRSKFLTSVKEKLQVAIKASPELVPDLLRLSLNDALTYDKGSKTGGANGSVRTELSRPENQGLEKAMNVLQDLKKEIDEGAKGGPITWSDLIHIGAQSACKRTFIDSAIRKCGGNEQKGLQLYGAYGSNGQWSQFDKLLGRFETSEPDPDGRVLSWEKASPAEIKERFANLGFKARQVAVLSAFLGPNQVETEAKLATDPDIAPWVKKYQDSRKTVSQTDYEVDLITAFSRLTTLGQTINYEAYSYYIPTVLRF